MYDTVGVPGFPENTLFVCYDAEIPSRAHVVPSHLPIREQRGMLSPSNAHADAILDLKGLDLPTKMMLSSRFRPLLPLPRARLNILDECALQRMGAPLYR